MQVFKLKVVKLLLWKSWVLSMTLFADSEEQDVQGYTSGKYMHQQLKHWTRICHRQAESFIFFYWNIVKNTFH